MNRKGLFLRRIVSTATFIVIVALPLITFAGEHGADAAEHHGPSLFVYWVNFLIFLALLVYLLKKPISAAWNGRTTAIGNQLQESLGKVRNAQSSLLQSQEKRSELDKTISNLVYKIKNDQETEVGEIISDAQAKSERVIIQAHELVRIERRAAQNQIKEELASYVIEKAASKITDLLDEKTDKALRTKAIFDVKQLVEN